MGRRLRRREIVLLALLLGLAFSYAAYHFVLGPQLRAFKSLKAELDNAGSLVSRLSLQAATVEEEKKALEEARRRYGELMTRFDTEMRDGQFLVELGRVAEKNEVRVMKFKPSPVEDRGYILVLPVEVEVKGWYPQVAEVLGYLENLPVLSELRSLEITRVEAPGPGASPAAGGVAVDGTVTAKTILLLYFQPTPAGRLQAEEVKRWALGRGNPFFPGEAIPLPSSGA
ncbi:type 4a pilus biogenesis protein PilO [Desulfovirgula thermocuniculi]|uniref:type 4a pilus biogenesis protein PilO n=1 Tax=Desulfovirgula thermocuniculi TaxID=348842 RepID=UPI0012EC8D18|nr:type 4a pilus biogenesis protein PilO [Desulfovirgula thermocuniculi]